MAEGVLETQEVEEGQGEEIQTAAAAAVPEQVTQKRATVASVKREIDGLRSDIETDVLDWLGGLDVRLEAMEKRTATHNEALLGDVKARLEIIEKGSLSDRGNVAADIAARLDTQEGAIGALVDVLRSHIDESDATKRSPADTAGFATPPEQPKEDEGRTATVSSMANVCQTMADVLMICRYLKNDPELTDEERIKVLGIAAERAGVPITQGLQIRAGVKNTTG